MNPSNLFQDPISALFSASSISEAVTSWCIFVILLMAIGSGILLGRKAFQWHRKLNKAHKLISDLTTNNLTAKRLEIRQEMSQIKILGELWHEFDETLVECPTTDRVYNTIDAEFFFNNSTLGSGVSENRWHSAIPGILTAIGVLGTFLGLMLGLNSLDLNDTAEMQNSIGGLISGASVAFTTSVWGIAASLVYNIYEKIVEGSLVKKIRGFQVNIDKIFDRNLSEKSLLNIQQNTNESEKLLRVLGEQIGDKIQEGISSAIEPQLKRLADMMGDMADRQASGAEGALRSLVEEFTSKLGNAGSAQAEAMEKSATSLSLSMEKLQETIALFLKNVESQIDQLVQTNKEGKEALDDVSKKAEQFASKSENAISGLTGVTKDFTDTIEGLRAATGDLAAVHGEFETTVSNFSKNQSIASASLDKSAQAIEGASAKITNAGESFVSVLGNVTKLGLSMEKLEETIASFLDKVESQVNQLIQTNKEGKQNLDDVSRRAEQLASKSSDGISNLTEVTEDFANTIDGLRSAIGDLSEIHGEFKTTVSLFSENQSRASTSLEKSSQAIEGASTRISNAGEGFLSVSGNIQNASETIEKLTTESAKLFASIPDENKKILEQAFAQLRSQLDQHTEKIAEQFEKFSELLLGSSQNRIEQWVQETGAFCNQMTGATQAMSNVIDEIEIKLDQNK